MSNPAVLLCVTVALVTARWIWIAGIGDYGWAYEGAHRIAHGEVQYRDFVSPLPPLTNYTLALLLAVLGNSLWVFAIHLYLWWYSLLAVGWLLARRLIQNRGLQTATLVFVAVLSNPADEAGHAYHYAGITCAGLTILFVLRALDNHRTREWLAAGVACGATVLARQNIGLGMGAAVGLVIVLIGVYERRAWQPMRSLMWFGLGVAGSLAPAMVYFAAHAGWREFLLQFFVDATAAKGGMLTILGRPLPRIILNPDTPYRRLVEAAISLPVLAVMGVWLWRRSRTSRDAAPARQAVSEGALRHSVAVFLVVLATLSAVSLVPIDRLAQLRSAGIAHTPGGANLSILVAYMFTILVFCAAALRTPRELRCAVVIVLGAAISLSTGTSVPFTYCVTGVVAVPLVMSILERWRASDRLPQLTLAASTVFVALTFFSGANVPVFVALTALPADSPFAGLYARADYAASTRALVRGVSPHIRGRRTLWILNPGPHSAFGGISVKNVDTIYRDSYSSRVEPLLAEAWRESPPEFVVFGPFIAPPGARFLTPTGIQKWLEGSFDMIWRDPAGATALWRRRSPRDEKTQVFSSR